MRTPSGPFDDTVTVNNTTALERDVGRDQQEIQHRRRQGNQDDQYQRHREQRPNAIPRCS